MAREQAVLAATAELLVERGYAALTTDAVAVRAGASKATIYRRWPNKAQLVRATLDAADAARNAARAPSSRRMMSPDVRRANV